MSIICVSISCQRTPIRILETFTFKDVNEAMFALKQVEGVEECALLQTCHRVEVYVYGSKMLKPDTVEAFFREKTSTVYALNEYADVYLDDDAVRHLFYVAAGLHSVLLGENEILHQVIECYERGRTVGAVGPALSMLFESAVQAGRKVRRETAINKGSISIGNLAVKAARRKLKSLDGRTVAIIGAGKIGCMIAKAVAKEKLQSIIIANRTFARAKKLAEMLFGTAVNFDKLEEVLARSDVVVCATAAPHRILSIDRVVSALARKHSDEKKRVLIIIDVSNPRGVDPEVQKISGVELLDLDELKTIAKQNQHARASVITIAKKLLEADITNVFKRLDAATHEQFVSRVMKWAEEKRQKNLDRAISALEFTETQKKILHTFSYSLMRDLTIPFIKPLRESPPHDSYTTVLSTILKEMSDRECEYAKPIATVSNDTRPRR